MRVVKASDNRIVLESDTHRAIVSKMLGNEKTDNWLLSAYELKSTSAGSSDIDTEPIGMQNGTAALHSTPSDNKDSERRENNKRIQSTKKARHYCRASFLSLLSDSNQRPRDYKSRALAN